LRVAMGGWMTGVAGGRLIALPFFGAAEVLVFSALGAGVRVPGLVFFTDVP
jgi:hypothetical protein